VTTRSRGRADTLLAACVLAFATAPVPLLLLGGRSEWGGTFGIVASAVALLASGALVYRYAIRPARSDGTGAGGRAVEVASWLAVVAFLVLASGINLLVGVARAGVVADSFLLLTLLALPVVILRRTPVEARLTRLPRSRVTIAVTVILVLASLVALIDLATPSRFPGGPKSRHADDSIGSLVRTPRPQSCAAVARFESIAARRRSPQATAPAPLIASPPAHQPSAIQTEEGAADGRKAALCSILQLAATPVSGAARLSKGHARGHRGTVAILGGRHARGSRGRS